MMRQRHVVANHRVTPNGAVAALTTCRLTATLLLGLVVVFPECVQAQERMIHDPFIYHENGVYYLLSTGNNATFKRSRDLWNWRNVGKKGTVFENPPAWAREILSRRPPKSRSGPNIWSPALYRFNGKYYLYSCAAIWGTNDQCIGLATNTTLDPSDPKYRWVDGGVVLKTVPKVHDFSAMTNILIADRKKYNWFLYGGWFSGIKLQRFSMKTGKLIPAKPFSLAARRPPKQRHFIGKNGIEGPFLHFHDGYWYLFVSFDLCAKGADSTYNVRVGRSRNIRGPYKDRKGVAMLSGGGTLLVKGYDNVRGPGSTQILVVDRKEFHVGHWYDANENGVPRLGVRPLVWAKDGWPMVGEMLKGPYRGAKKFSGRQLKAAIVGKWKHSVDFAPAISLHFLKGGKIAGGPATWKLRGNRLTLRFPDPKAPGGVWVNECVLADDGTWYVGRYGPGNGIIIRGSK